MPTTATQPGQDSHRRWIAAGVLAAMFAAAAASTWNRWGDIIVDCGHELDAPRQLLAGKVLYRDVRYFYGPFTTCFHALLYGLFGVKVGTLTTAGLAVSALLVMIAYRVLRFFTGRAAAVAGCTAIIWTNLFGHYYLWNIFNFVLPYSYPATYGMLFAVASLYLLLRHVFRNRSRDFLLSCLCLGLVFLCKAEIAFAAAAMHAVFVITAVIGRTWRSRCHASGYVLALAIPLAVYGWFYARTGPALWYDNLFISQNVRAGPFALLHSGLGDLPLALQEMGWSLAGMVTCVALGWLAIRAGSMAAPLRHAVMIACAAACAAVILRLGPPLVLRGLPLLLLAILIRRAIQVARRREAARMETARIATAELLLGTLALASLARIVLRAGAEHYGFFMTVPAMLAWTVFWTRTVPGFLRSTGKRRARFAPEPAYICGVVLLLAVAAAHGNLTRRTAASAYGEGPTPRITTVMGTLPLIRPYVDTVGPAIVELSRVARDRTVIALPEGAGMTFLAGAVNPLGMWTFLPFEFCGSYTEENVTRRVTEANPDFIVLTSRDVSEYGKRGLGLDYGQALMNRVMSDYSMHRVWSNPAYEVAILVRNDLAAAPPAR